MFRIEFMCEDRHLPPILHALSGRALNLNAIPVVNAEPTKQGSVKARTTGDIVDLLVKYIKDNKIQQLSSKDIKNFATKNGKSPDSYSYIVRQATNAGLIKRISAGQYELRK